MWQQYYMHGRMADLWRYRANSGERNFLGGSFSNKNNVRASIRFRRKSQPQHFKRWFFLKKRPIHFHINSTSVVGPVKRIQVSSSGTEISKPLSVPVQCIVDQIKVQKPILVVATNRIESSIISIDSNITDNNIRKVIKSVGQELNLEELQHCLYIFL